MGVLDILLGWVLYLHPALGILLISLLVSGIITLAIKLFTNQTLMKDLRAELKELQKEMKTLRDNPKKMSKVNSQFMDTNMKYMSHSMRPTLFTFIPIILVFGWLNSHIGYYPLQPDMPFEVTAIFDKAGGTAKLIEIEGLTIQGDMAQDINFAEIHWTLSGDEGEYMLQLDYNGKIFEKELIITNERKYAPVEQAFKKGLFGKSEGLQKIVLSNERIVPFSDVPLIKEIPWVNNWGWLGVYFLFSIVFSLGLRKIFKIH